MAICTLGSHRLGERSLIQRPRIGLGVPPKPGHAQSSIDQHGLKLGSNPVDVVCRLR